MAQTGAVCGGVGGAIRTDRKNDGRHRRRFAEEPADARGGNDVLPHGIRMGERKRQYGEEGGGRAACPLKNRASEAGVTPVAEAVLFFCTPVGDVLTHP